MSLPLIILASSSISRRQQLQKLRLPFHVQSPNIDEIQHPDELVQDYVTRLSYEKAFAVAGRCEPALVIAGDQVVECENQVLTKPLDHWHAVQQLKSMSGKTVLFHTGLCLLNTYHQRQQIEYIVSVAKLRCLNEQMIENYLKQETPYHCCASLKVECVGIALFEYLEAQDPTAVTGLPLIALISMLCEEGVFILT